MADLYFMMSKLKQTKLSVWSKKAICSEIEDQKPVSLIQGGQVDQTLMNLIQGGQVDLTLVSLIQGQGGQEVDLTTLVSLIQGSQVDFLVSWGLILVRLINGNQIICKDLGVKPSLII